MSFKQKHFVFSLTDDDGNIILCFPITSVDCVEGAIKNISLVDRSLEITFSNGDKKYIDGIVGDVYTKSETDSKLMDKLNTSEVANTSGKIPRYSEDGHLVLPSGVELW